MASEILSEISKHIACITLKLLQYYNISKGGYFTIAIAIL